MQMAIQQPEETQGRRIRVRLAGEGWDAVRPVLEALEATGRFIFASAGEADVVLAAVEGQKLPAGIRRLPGGEPVLLCLQAAHGELPEVSEHADDFVLLPCPPRELEQRIRRLLRQREEAARAKPLRLDGMELDRETYQVSIQGRPVRLTPLEFKLLRYLAERAGRIVPRRQLLSEVWGPAYHGSARTVDVHIRRLRAKLGAGASRYLKTVRSVGYGIVVPRQG
jgi:DNA-binding response OmpR family regulator